MKIRLDEKIVILGFCFTLLISACNATSPNNVTIPSITTPKETKKNEIPDSSTQLVETKINMVRTIEPTKIIGTQTPQINNYNIQTTVQNLLEMNNNCELPCWWGVEVGKTKIIDGSRFFETLDKNSVTNSGQIAVGKINKLEIRKGFNYEFDNQKIHWSLSGIDEFVSKINISTNITDQFGIMKIINKMGKPDNAYIFTLSEIPDLPPVQNYYPFNLLLTYSRQNNKMFIWYLMKGNKENSNIVACTEDYEIYVWIWNSDFTEEDYESQILLSTVNGDSSKIRKIEDATSMDLDKLVSEVKNNQRICFRSPSKIW